MKQLCWFHYASSLFEISSNIEPRFGYASDTALLFFNLPICLHLLRNSWLVTLIVCYNEFSLVYYWRNIGYGRGYMDAIWTLIGGRFGGIFIRLATVC